MMAAILTTIYDKQQCGQTKIWDRKCKITFKVSLPDIADTPKIFTKLYIYQNERCFVCQGKIGVHNGSDSALRIGLNQKYIYTISNYIFYEWPLTHLLKASAYVLHARLKWPMTRPVDIA